MDPKNRLLFYCLNFLKPANVTGHTKNLRQGLYKVNHSLKQTKLVSVLCAEPIGPGL
jgi:hypothetical protein